MDSWGFFTASYVGSLRIFPSSFSGTVILNTISMKLYLSNGHVAHTDDKSQHAIFCF